MTAAISPQNADMSTYIIETFSSYTFEISGFGDNYIVTASAAGGGKAVLLTVEDNNFNSTDYEMPAPEGFFVSLIGTDNCFVIKAPQGNPDVPDLLQINFEPEGGGTPVACFYGLRDRELLPIGIYTTIPYNLSEMTYCEDTVLIRTEDYKFMPPPVVVWNSENQPIVSIYTYTFDPNRMTLTKAKEKITPENQLYFAYSALGTGEDVASLFSTKNLAAASETEFVSIKNTDTAEDEYYFLVSDPRFSSTDELIAFSNNYFAPEITAEMFKNAPQKYRDINGKLYTQKLTGVEAKPFPVIADILEEDTDLSVLISGGGSVVIRKDADGGSLIVKYALV
jgi:hypothetical protein